MSTHASDRNLLFGVLALQMDFIDRDALVAALHTWILDKYRSLGDILVAQQVLNPDEHNVLDALVQKHLDRHRGDGEQSLAAVAVPTTLLAELHSLADADVQASLAHLPTPSEPDESNALPVTVDEVENSPRLRSHNLRPAVAGLRYQILRPHNKGGIGEVFVALDQELNREVALKEIQERHAADPHSRGRFVREAEITGGLEHPGIVPVYGLGQYADGRPFYAMRFIQGETLKDAIARHHQTSAEGSRARSPEFERRALLRHFVAVCNALAYAHSRGVLHRDLKPSNIMLGKYGETLVVDWGLAKAGLPEPARSAGEGLPEPSLVPALADTSLTQAGSTMGTPAYMSPEQASGRLDLLGPASDIYSLGATLYTLLTGRPPIEDRETAGTLRKAQRGEWLPPRQVKPDVPPALDAVCRKAMAAAPSERYATALELAADIEHWLADEPVSAYRESWAARSQRWLRWHRTLMSTAVAVLVVALLGTTVGLVLVSDAERKEAAARQKAEDKEREVWQQKEETRFNQYVAQMNLVQRDYETNNIDRVRELLKAQVPSEADVTDFRNFEWHYWHRMCHRELLVLQTKGNTNEVTAVAFSPDGRRLASASVDGIVRVWDANAGKELLTLKGHTLPVLGVAFSPDGRLLASASSDQTIRLWDAATGKELLPPLKGHAGEVRCVAFSPDSRLASAGLDRTVRVWNAVTGKELLTIRSHTLPVSAVAFSSDGRRLASAGYDRTVRLWDAATGKELLSLKGHSNYVLGVAFNSDGRRLASAGGDASVWIWDTETGKELLSLKGHAGEVRGVAFSPDGQRLASAGDDATVRVWDAASGKELLILKGHTGRVSGVSFRPDGRHLASAGDGAVRLWCATTGHELLSLRAHIRVTFSPDGRRLVSTGGDSMVRVRDAATGQELLTLKGHTGKVNDVSVSPDGRWLASAGSDASVRIWDAAAGKELLILKGHTDTVTSVAFSPAGRWLASAGGDATVRIWDVATGKELLSLKGHVGEVRGVAFSPDGRQLASAGDDATVRIWDAASGKELFSRKRHKGRVSGVSFSPDGRRLASAGNDLTVQLWDAATGQELLTLKGHANAVNCVTFSPDGQRLASASSDRTVRIWDASTGQELLSLKGHTDVVYGVAFSPDGWRLASAGRDWTVRIWEAAPVADAVWRQRWLVSRVTSLFEELGFRQDVLAALRKDSTLRDSDREFALHAAQTHPRNAGQLNEASWNVVKNRDASKDAYARALRLAVAAIQEVPQDGDILNTLGVAQYRAGLYADALDTLTKSEKLNTTKTGSHPADLSFLAMSQYQNGKKDEAKATLDRFRTVMRQSRWAQDAESVSFLREAEELIEGKTAPTK